MGPEATNGNIVGVIFFAWFLYSVSHSHSFSLSLYPLSLSLSLTHSLSLSLSLSRSLAVSLSLSLTLISNYIHAYMCLTVGRQSRDHRPLSRDPSVSFTKSFLIAWNVQKRCLTVSRRSRDLQPLSRDRSATFFKISQIAWNVQKTLFDQSADGSRDLRQLSRDRSATFSKFSQIAWNVQKTLFDSRPTVAWPPTTVAWPFSDFFQKISNCLKRCKIVVWQSADSRVTSDQCRVTVQRLFSKKFLIAWNVQKTLFDSPPTVAWPPTTVGWPFSDFFQKISQIAWNVQKTLFDSRPTVAWPPTTVAWPFSDFFQKISNCLKRRKIVVWQSADSRVTSDHCRVTVQRLFSKNFLIAWNVQKTLFDSRPTVAWPQPLSRDRSATFFKIFPNRLKGPKNVVWQSADGRVTSDHYRVTVQQLFKQFF